MNSFSIFFLLISFLILSCGNDEIDNLPDILFPENLTFQCPTQDVILNPALFENYVLSKGDSAVTNRTKSTVVLDSTNACFLKRLDLPSPDTFHRDEYMTFNISFRCPDCKYVFLHRQFLNDSTNIPKVKQLLPEYAFRNRSEKKSRNGYYSFSKKATALYKGDLAFTLYMVSEAEEIFCYELISVTTLNED